MGVGKNWAQNRMVNTKNRLESLVSGFKILTHSRYDEDTRGPASRKSWDSTDWFLRENLNRKPWFLPCFYHEIYGFPAVSCKFSHHPIL